ncbi:MAG: class I SAM-dependent methyltransferase [Planctomycetota bacterium]
MSDAFHQVYDREDIAYGLTPSAELAAYLHAVHPTGTAIDLGAGAGRDTLALAAAGLQVTSVDLSPRGLERIVQRATERGIQQHVTTVHADVREFDFPVGTVQVLCATTVLDHIPSNDADAVWPRFVQSLDPTNGVMYVEVHSTEDPASDQPPGCDSSAPRSETAEHVVNYFAPGRLVRMALDAGLRVLRYEERIEWDKTHGPEHQHGKQILLACVPGFCPEWFGHPKAFPKP